MNMMELSVRDSSLQDTAKQTDWFLESVFYYY